MVEIKISENPIITDRFLSSIARMKIHQLCLYTGCPTKKFKSSMKIFSISKINLKKLILDIEKNFIEDLNFFVVHPV